MPFPFLFTVRRGEPSVALTFPLPFVARGQTLLPRKKSLVIRLQVPRKTQTKQLLDLKFSVNSKKKNFRLLSSPQFKLKFRIMKRAVRLKRRANENGTLVFSKKMLPSKLLLLLRLILLRRLASRNRVFLLFKTSSGL